MKESIDRSGCQDKNDREVYSVADPENSSASFSGNNINSSQGNWTLVELNKMVRLVKSKLSDGDDPVAQKIM